MNEEQLNMQIRRFLKKVGIQSQKEIERAIEKARDDGTLKPGEVVKARMQLSIPEVSLDVTIDGDIALD